MTIKKVFGYKDRSGKMNVYIIDPNLDYVYFECFLPNNEQNSLDLGIPFDPEQNWLTVKVKVDEEDIPKLKSERWSMGNSIGTRIFSRKGKEFKSKSTKHLHHVVAGASPSPEKKFCAHINKDIYDNRKQNLEWRTQEEKTANAKTNNY